MDWFISVVITLYHEIVKDVKPCCEELPNEIGNEGRPENTIK